MSDIYKTLTQQIFLYGWDNLKFTRFQCWRRTHPCVPVSNQWLAAYPGDNVFLLFTPVSIPRRVTSQVTLEGTSPRTMQQCHCGARLAQCGSSARPQAFVIRRRRSGEQAQFTANPLPQKSCLGRRGVEKLRWLLLLLAPSSPNLVVVGVPTLLNSFLIYIQSALSQLLQTRLLATGIYNMSYIIANNPSKYVVDSFPQCPETALLRARRKQKKKKQQQHSKKQNGHPATT